MAERLEHSAPEREIDSSELEKSADRQHERIKENLEVERAEAEKSSEQSAEAAKHEALETAASSEKDKQTEEKAAPAAEKRKDKLQHLSPKKREAAAFAMEMKEARSQMSAPSQAFSKVIHNKAVEKTSDAVGATIARPNAMLWGAVFAFVITGVLYGWAKWAGYPLSGFETIGAFIIGWLLGIIFDFTRIMVTGKR